MSAARSVLIVDDLLATGGTALAAAALVEKLGGVVAGMAFIVNLPDIGGEKKIREKVDSDWRDYYGSSDALLSDVAALGIDSFKREIIYFCTSKSACSYLEAKLQFQYNVLESDDWYNNNIMIRVHGNHIRDKKMIVSL